MGNYYIDFAKKIDYEVRVITHITAYKWLSEETIEKITYARQNTQVDVSVG